MTQAEINKAVRSLAYLQSPDRVRAGVANTYGVRVPIERVARILSVVQAEGSHRTKVAEPKPNDAYDFDVRVSRNSRVQRVEPIAKRDKPALRERAPLPVAVPKATVNPYTGPFSVRRLAASIGADFGLTADDVLGPCRKRTFILPRLVLTKLCIEHGLSCSQIGRKMGGRDHSTILHQRDVFEPYRAKYPMIGRCYDRHVALRAAAKGGAV